MPHAAREHPEQFLRCLAVGGEVVLPAKNVVVDASDARCPGVEFLRPHESCGLSAGSPEDGRVAGSRLFQQGEVAVPDLCRLAGEGTADE
jgi:hypothetical protein